MKQKNLNGMVSVGVPTYNRPDLLRRALEIITNQTYSNLEIIVSDNASTDLKVRQVVDEFASRDPRITYYRQENNVGVLANADFVLRESQGEYFAWFSDDDWRSPEFIEILIEELENNREVNFAFCDYHEVYADGSRAEGYPSSHLEVFKPFGSQSRLIRTISYYWQDAVHGKPNIFYSVFRRSVIAELDIEKLTEGYVHLNMDCLISFAMLQKGPMVIREEAMCTLTCGNKKHYLGDEGQINPQQKTKLSKLVYFFSNNKKDRDLYISNTEHPIEKLFIYSLFVPKLLTLLARITLKKIMPGNKSHRTSGDVAQIDGKQKIQLPNVTLVAMATRNVEETLQALIYSCKGIEYGQVKLISHYTPHGMPKSIEFVRIDKIKSIDDWSYKIVYELAQHIETEFALLVHADGFVVNPSSWREEFLEYDYIGAPWPLPTDSFSYRDVHGEIVRVGNSVSLRSKRLLELPIRLNLPWEPYCGFFNEDGFICVKNKHIYEENGMRFAPLSVAKYFSHEAMIHETRDIKPFVFHKWAGSNSIYPKF